MSTIGYIDPVHLTGMSCTHPTPPLSAMHKLSSSQVSHILFLMDSGYSGHAIHQKTGLGITTISRVRSEHRPNLSKPLGGRPCLLSIINISYAKRIIHTGKVDNAAEAAVMLRGHTTRGFSTETLRRGLKENGMVSVVKKKRPLLK